MLEYFKFAWPCAAPAGLRALYEHGPTASAVGYSVSSLRDLGEINRVTKACAASDDSHCAQDHRPENLIAEAWSRLASVYSWTATLHLQEFAEAFGLGAAHRNFRGAFVGHFQHVT